MESRGPEDSKNVRTSQAYFFEGFISFFEDFSLTILKIACVTKSSALVVVECLTLSFEIVSQEVLNLCDIFQL